MALCGVALCGVALAGLNACATGPAPLDMPDRGRSTAFNAEEGTIESPAPSRAATFWAEILWLDVRASDEAYEVIGNQEGDRPVLRFGEGTRDEDTPDTISLEVGDLDLVRAGLAARRWPFDDGEVLRFDDPDGRPAIVSQQASGD